MRDSVVIDELSRMKKRNAIVYKQMVFCNTRMQAFEKVLQGSGIVSRLLLIIWPGSFMGAVNKLQLQLMSEHDEALRQAEQAPAPQKLSVVQNGQLKEVSVNGHS